VQERRNKDFYDGGGKNRKVRGKETIGKREPAGTKGPVGNTSQFDTYKKQTKNPHNEGGPERRVPVEGAVGTKNAIAGKNEKLTWAGERKRGLG